MKHLTYLFFLSTLLLGCNNAFEERNETQIQTPVAHSTNEGDIKVITCEPDYQPINYCSDTYIKKLNNEANLPANFDGNKRIVTTKLKMKSDGDIYKYYFIVIDLDKRTATPISQILAHYGNRTTEGFNPNITPTAVFNVESNTLCFNGSLIGYRDAYPNVKNACYEYKVDGVLSGSLIPSNESFGEIFDQVILEDGNGNGNGNENEQKETTTSDSLAIDNKDKTKLSLPISESIIQNEDYNVSYLDENNAYYVGLEDISIDVAKKIQHLLRGSSASGLYALPNYKDKQVILAYGLFEDESEEFITEDNPYGVHVDQEKYLIFIKDEQIKTVELGDKFTIDTNYNVISDGKKLNID